MEDEKQQSEFFIHELQKMLDTGAEMQSRPDIEEVEKEVDSKDIDIDLTKKRSLKKLAMTATGAKAGAGGLAS